ncbi:MAG: TfoX/Sxy family protein [Actinomycetota bacterium]
MAYDEELGDRVREILLEDGEVDERKMFGGLAFMVNGNMCCGIVKEDLMLRLGEERGESALEEPHVRPMDFSGRPMKGYVYVAPAGSKDEAELRKWIRLARAFIDTLPPK